MSKRVRFPDIEQTAQCFRPKHVENVDVSPDRLVRNIATQQLMEDLLRPEMWVGNSLEANKVQHAAETLKRACQIEDFEILLYLRDWLNLLSICPSENQQTLITLHDAINQVLAGNVELEKI